MSTHTTPDPFAPYTPPGDIAFSYFSSYIAAAPPHTAKTVTLADLCAGIQRGTWAQPVAHVREFAPHRWDRDPDNPKQKGELAAEYTSRKDRLPYAVLSGTWDPAHRHADGATHAKKQCDVNGMISPSGLRLIDLDPPPGHSIDAVRAHLDNDAIPWAAAYWLSAGGDGLHIAAWVDPAPTDQATSHAAYAMLCKDLSARIPAAMVGNDSSSKNLMRPAFVSHDADARLRHDAQPLQWLDRTTTAQPHADAPEGSPRTEDPFEPSQARTEEPARGSGHTAADANRQLILLALEALARGNAGEDDNHLLATLGNMRACGFGFPEFDQWAADAGCTCADRASRWASPPQGTQSTHPGWAIVNLASSHYGFEKPHRERQPRADNPDSADEEGGRKISDAAALVKHAADDFLYVGRDLAIRTPGNLWMLYDHADRDCRGLLSEVIRDARIAEGADPDACDPPDAALNSVINNLLGRARRGAFRTTDITDFDRTPLVPFTDGSHLHLDQRLPESCNCRLERHLALDHGWAVPPPDWDETTLPDLLTHFDPDILKEMAQRIWGPDKSCDFLLAPNPGSGKSSISIVLSETMPGLVYRMDTSEIKEHRLAFSVHTKPLSSSRVVLYDEAARAGVKWTDVLYAMTDIDIDVNDKHAREKRHRRIGTPVFLGPDQPDIDTSQQGIVARIGAVWQHRADAHSVDSARLALWRSPTERARLLTWMLEVALRGPRDPDKISNQTARQDFILNGEDPLTADVLDVLGSLDPAELHHLDTLIGFLEAAGVELPTTKTGEVVQNDLAKAIRTAFPGANSRNRRRPGQKPCKLWQGVGARTAPA